MKYYQAGLQENLSCMSLYRSLLLYLECQDLVFFFRLLFVVIAQIHWIFLHVVFNSFDRKCCHNDLSVSLHFICNKNA